jgi:glycine hydroxymethyltransferase
MTEQLHEARELAEKLDSLAARHTRWRDGGTINLNAATNSLSRAARAALSTSLADKGISSGLHSRHHQGGRYIDETEELLTALTARMLGGATADLRAPTGSLANAIALAALGDRHRPVLTGGPRELGHFSLHAAGWGGLLAGGVEFVPFLEDGITIDGEVLLRRALAAQPAVIVVGSQAMLFPLDLGPVQAAADQVGALVIYDAAHPLGLIAAGRFQRPLAEGADVITGSTQKSLPGPVGGVIVTRTEELGRRVYDATNAYMSNYQNNRVLAYGYTMVEMRAFGAQYAAATIENARRLAGAFAGHGLVPLFAERGYTESNQFLVPWGNHEAATSFARLCERANIIVSVIALPGGAARQASHGLRIGVQDLTRHGLTPGQFQQVADAVAVLARDPGRAERVAADMSELAAQTATVYYDLEHGLPPQWALPVRRLGHVHQSHDGAPSATSVRAALAAATTSAPNRMIWPLVSSSKTKFTASNRSSTANPVTIRAQRSGVVRMAWVPAPEPGRLTVDAVSVTRPTN